MGFRLVRMGIEGAIAVGNLGLLGIALLVHRLMLPSGFVDFDKVSEAELLVNQVVEVAIAVLSFPVGWLSLFFTIGVSGPPLFAVVFLPLNAYLWGYSIAAFLRLLRSRRSAGPATGDRG